MKMRRSMLAVLVMGFACAMQAQVAVKHLQDDKSPIASGVWAGDTLYLSGQLASPVTPADPAKADPWLPPDGSAGGDGCRDPVRRRLGGQP